MTMVELFKLGAAEFSSDAELMLANSVGDDVGEVPGDILATLWGRLADAIEASDGDVRSPCQTGGVEIGSKIQSRMSETWKPWFSVIKNLTEIIDAGEDLVGEARRQHGVPRNCIVRHVNRRDLVVILQLGSGFRERRAADWSDLVPLSNEIVNGEGVLIVDFVVELRESVVAITKFRIGTGVVVS